MPFYRHVCTFCPLADAEAVWHDASSSLSEGACARQALTGPAGNGEGTEAFSLALATQMAINLLESYEKWLKEERAKEEK